MEITSEQIDIWRQLRSENQRLEFKEAKQQYDYKKLCQYCVAIANEGGGFLVLGVSDKPPREVVGTKACADAVAHAQKLFETLGFRVDIAEIAHPAGRVLVFEIPSRPKGTA
ncbi:MAG TPA: ATP-binding protein [Bryobacteraceae bacterium]|nr:ATP-binding protein [Bryobacteraceae bacterium]